MTNKIENNNNNDIFNNVLGSDEVLYKKIDEIKLEYFYINDVTKRKVKINIGDEIKWIHLINIEYRKPNKAKKSLLLMIPKQKLLEINYNKKQIKIEINDEIERKIKSLETHLIKLIHEKSSDLFNGKIFSVDKIKNALISNIKCNKKKFMSLTINDNTKIYEIERCGSRTLIDSNNINIDKSDIIECKCVIYIENLQFVDNKFTYNLVVDLCEIERSSNYSFVIKNGEFKRGGIESEEDDSLLDDEYWDSASI